MNSYKDILELDSIEMKVVRIFLLAFVILLAFQTVQFINVRRIDRKHSELMVQKNQSLESLQNLLVQGSTIQRKLLNLALTEDEVEIAELEGIISEASLSIDQSLATLTTVAMQIDPGNLEAISSLKRSYADYQGTYRAYRDLILQDRTEAAAFRQQSLRPAYENYQELQQQMLLMITHDLVAESQHISRNATVSGWILFFLGLAPFIFAITKLIYLSVFMKFKTSQVTINRKHPDTRL